MLHRGRMHFLGTDECSRLMTFDEQYGGFSLKISDPTRVWWPRRESPSAGRTTEASRLQAVSRLPILYNSRYHNSIASCATPAHPMYPYR